MTSITNELQYSVEERREVTETFERFLKFFEKRFDCKVHVLPQMVGRSTCMWIRSATQQVCFVR
ncbi:hypothetical protein PHMEG_00032062 [Phytophthora megakarya]|uniref:Uncharacterized protein n=1 Tax=Phytophthora megakarya TaxID=4795 RepID=A0A225UYZ3_9STRA|nr:hypothetical protein PHMEG_00032062 [Phytophthora megakarya]